MRNFIDIVSESLLHHNITVDHDKIVRAVLDEVDWSSSSSDMIKAQFVRDTDFDNGKEDRWDDDFDGPDFSDVDIKSDDFFNWFSNYVDENYSEAEWDITSKIKNGHLTIWRSITAPEDWNPESQHPGIFWTYDENVAEPHWGQFGEGHVEWIMQATVPLDAIDWLRTLIMSGNPDFRHEKEIRLVDNFPVKLDGYWQDGKKPQTAKAA